MQVATLCCSPSVNERHMPRIRLSPYRNPPEPQLSAFGPYDESKHEEGTQPSKIAADLVGFLAAMWLLCNQTTSGPA
jgi:hypothetical protein